MLTRLIQGEEDGERLSERELLHNIIFILNAGHETTTNLIGNGLYALLEWPEEKARLIARPELIRTAVEEFLRFESSNQLGNRLTTRAVEVGGVPMPAGTFMTIGIGAANRDPPSFPIPTGSTSRASPTATSPSGPARMCASGSTWRAWRAASPSAASWRGFPAMRWLATRCAAGGRDFGGFSRSQ